ncbi:hypothetical protein ACLMNJ_20550 [Streptomyces seoulensis]
MTTETQTNGQGGERAAAAAEAILKALIALGLPEDIRGGVRPMVTRGGKAYVYLGLVRADVAERMAEAMRPAAGTSPSPLHGLPSSEAAAGPSRRPEAP